MKEIIRCENVTKRFQQGDVTINAVVEGSLSVYEGDFICLTGPSGSGKSTLLHVLGTLESFDDGDVWIDGVSIRDLSASEKAKIRLNYLGFIFQSHNLIPVFSALENVSFVLELQGVARKERRERSESMLEAVGLKELLHRRPHEMSGGQQQRVAIARALVTKPIVIFADEPTASLDSVTSAQVMELLQSLNESHGVAVLYATHDRSAMTYAHSYLMIRDGVITASDEGPQ